MAADQVITHDVWASAPPEDGAADPWIGIDLGTTNSVVAVWLISENRVKAIRDRQGNKVVPSVVSLFRDAAGDWRHSAGSEAAAQAPSFPRSTVASVKRLMGRYEPDVPASLSRGFRVVAQPFGQEEDNVPDPHHGRPAYVEVEDGGHKTRYAPQAVSALMLGALKLQAERFARRPLQRAVIAVPAHFTDPQRKATRIAAMLAGFAEVRLLAEPTAAAMAYGLFVAGSKTVVVFDLGGGTFDISVLRIDEGRVQVLAVGGDTQLGGDDITEALLRAKLAGEGDVEPHSAAMADLRARVEAAKCAAGADDFASAAEVAAAADPVYDRCLEILREVVHESGRQPGDVDEVVMVGGCTRAAELRRRVSAFFGGKELCTSVDPDLAVAEGAAIQAALLSGVKKGHLQDVLMLDALPHDIGLELADGSMKVVLPRNSPIPTTVTEWFQVAEEGQEGITVEVFEGSDPVAANNKWLGYLNFPLPADKRRPGAEQAVTFKIDDHGVLQIAPGTAEEAAGAAAAEEAAESDRVPLSLLAWGLVLFALYIGVRVYFAEMRAEVQGEAPVPEADPWSVGAAGAAGAAGGAQPEYVDDFEPDLLAWGLVLFALYIGVRVYFAEMRAEVQGEAPVPEADPWSVGAAGAAGAAGGAQPEYVDDFE